MGEASDFLQLRARKFRQDEASDQAEPRKVDPKASFESEAAQRGRYLPALKYRWLTPFYDPVIRWLFHEDAMKTRLVKQVALCPEQRVLDLGCGTGTLAISLKRVQPRAIVVGFDGDSDSLLIARRKAAQAGVEVVWDRGMAHALPYSDGSFNAVVASLMLHHLIREDKTRALREVYRVLRAGGSFHVADFGTPQNSLMRALGKVGKLLEETADRVEGCLPGMFQAAGLQGMRETRGSTRPWDESSSSKRG